MTPGGLEESKPTAAHLYRKPFGAYRGNNQLPSTRTAHPRLLLFCNRRRQVLNPFGNI